MRAPRTAKAAAPIITAALQILLNNLSRKLELAAGFLTGAERFTLNVDHNSDTSSWNWKRLIITIGLKGIPEKSLGTFGHILMRHECGHVLHTSRNLDPQKIGYPFSLLNILEDARIEHKDGETDFGQLHSHAYGKYYQEKPEAAANPYNIGVLLRWRKWAVETETARPPAITEAQYNDFLTDWQTAIDNSIEASSTEAVHRHAKTLYLKWKALFDAAKAPETGQGSGISESSPAELLGQAEPTDKEKQDSSHDSDGGIHDIKRHFNGKAFTWDLPYVQRQAAILKKLLDLKSRTEETFGMKGRRFDPRRIENPPLPPFREKLEISKTLHLEKLLRIVIDGSGSMQDDPFRAASHVARILSLIFPVAIDITTTESREPIRVPLAHIDILSKYTSWGGGENYRSIGKKATGYAFTLFLTDANVIDEDAQYVKDQLRKMTKLGAGYVGEHDHQLDEVFERTFFSTTLNEDIARMIALFIKRNFTDTIKTTL